jgi:hypothetical protein
MRPQPHAQSEKAHECRHHESTGRIRRSARDGVNGLLREYPRCSTLGLNHRSRGLPRLSPPSVRGANLGAAPWRKAMRRDTATWAVRVDVVVTASARLRHRQAGGRPRASAIEHRSRPPHPAPRTVTIAIRPSPRDETKEFNPRADDLSSGVPSNPVDGRGGGSPPGFEWSAGSRMFMVGLCRDS